MNSFYRDQNYIYPELCIVKEEFNISQPGIVKCFIPSIMPFIKEGEPEDFKIRPSNSHLDNDDKTGIEPSGDSYISNYILVHLPNYITDITRDVAIIPNWNTVEDTTHLSDKQIEFKDESIYEITPNISIRKRYFFPLSRYDIDTGIIYAKKDQRFISVFIGGNISNIKIIGRYDECPLQEPTLSPNYLVSEVPWISHTTGLQ